MHLRLTLPVIITHSSTKRIYFGEKMSRSHSQSAPDLRNERVPISNNSSLRSTKQAPTHLQDKKKRPDFKASKLQPHFGFNVLCYTPYDRLVLLDCCMEGQVILMIRSRDNPRSLFALCRAQPMLKCSQGKGAVSRSKRHLFPMFIVIIHRIARKRQLSRTGSRNASDSVSPRSCIFQMYNRCFKT